MLFCLDGMSVKQKNGLLLTAVLSLCLGCQIALCTTFQTFWRRNFVTSLVPTIFSASKPFLHTAFFSPTTNCFHLEDAKAHLVWCHSGPCWTHFLAEHRTFCSQCCHCCGKSCHDWTGFGRSFLLEDSRHVTVVLSLFRLWGQFQVELPSRWPLKHSTGVRFHPCFCQLVCHCLHFCTFPSFSYFKSRQTMLQGNSRGIQAPQGAQLRLLYQTSPRS